MLPDCNNTDFTENYINKRNIIIFIMAKTKCKYCAYVWVNRVEVPKACPYCKMYIKKEVDQNGSEPEANRSDYTADINQTDERLS
jgi:hypothetical protein